MHKSWIWILKTDDMIKNNKEKELKVKKMIRNQLIYVRYGTGITVHIVISLKHTREYGTIRSFVVRTYSV